MTKFASGLLAFLLAAVLVTACGSATTAASSGGGASAATITVSNYAFSPKTLTVKPGATVTVDNRDSVTHTVTDSGKFSTGDVASGATKTFTAPTAPGTYPYMCMIHPFMTATLVVS